jgi:hypothetical protein
MSNTNIDECEYMKFIKNQLHSMCDINNDDNLELIKKYGVKKFAIELRDWTISDRNIFQQLKI